MWSWKYVMMTHVEWNRGVVRSREITTGIFIVQDNRWRHSVPGVDKRAHIHFRHGYGSQVCLVNKVNGTQHHLAQTILDRLGMLQVKLRDMAWSIIPMTATICTPNWLQANVSMAGGQLVNTGHHGKNLDTGKRKTRQGILKRRIYSPVLRFFSEVTHQWCIIWP